MFPFVAVRLKNIPHQSGVEVDFRRCAAFQGLKFAARCDLDDPVKLLLLETCQSLMDIRGPWRTSVLQLWEKAVKVLKNFLHRIKSMLDLSLSLDSAAQQ